MLEHLVVVPDVADPATGTVIPVDSDHDLVVLMGAPWSVYDTRIRKWLDPELELIRNRLAIGAPVLGICFGAQAMSAALGGSVTKSDRPEYGWVPVGSGSDHIDEGPWFQFHHDGFSLPPEAEELARNRSGLQAFRLGPGLAVQFHPEMSVSLLESWCEAGGDEEHIEAGADVDVLLEETRTMEVSSQPSLERMLDWFLDGMGGTDPSH